LGINVLVVALEQFAVVEFTCSLGELNSSTFKLSGT